MNKATLIREPKENHVPPPLTGADKDILDAFYARYNVTDKTSKEKNEALMKVIQARNFFAFGGGETQEMELRANERIFLSQHGQRI